MSIDCRKRDSKVLPELEMRRVAKSPQPRLMNSHTATALVRTRRERTSARAAALPCASTSATTGEKRRRYVHNPLAESRI
jgi:hypothetical protein